MIFPEGTRSKPANSAVQDRRLPAGDRSTVPCCRSPSTEARDALRKHDWRLGYAEAEVRVLDPISTETMDDVTDPQRSGAQCDRRRTRRTPARIRRLSNTVSVPVRLLAAADPVPSALLVAIATSTAVFTATPFFLSSVAEQYNITIGTAGLTSTAQLGGFVVASWVGGRSFIRFAAVFVIGTLLGVVSNLGWPLRPRSSCWSCSTSSAALAARFRGMDAAGLFRPPRPVRRSRRRRPLGGRRRLPTHSRSSCSRRD